MIDKKRIKGGLAALVLAGFFALNGCQHKIPLQNTYDTKGFSFIVFSDTRLHYSKLKSILRSSKRLNQPDVRFLVGGGDIAMILSTTDEPEIVRHRNKILKENNWTLEQFREVCRSYTDEVDPLTYAKLIDPSKILMMNGYFDKVVLIDFTEKLWKEMGKPDLKKMFCGHYTAALYLPYAKARSVEHFRKKLLGIKPNKEFENKNGY